MAVFAKKGTEILDPADPSRGYRITRDVLVGEYIMSEQFEPIGDVPKPMPGVELPKFLGLAIKGMRPK